MRDTAAAVVLASGESLRHNSDSSRPKNPSTFELDMTNGSARRWAWLPACLSTLLCVVFMVWRTPAPAAQGMPANRIADELLVKFRPDASASRRSASLSRVGALLRRHFEQLDLDHVRVPPGQTDVALARLAVDPDIAAVQPNYIRH